MSKCYSKNQASHLQVLSKRIGKTLSSYTQAINLQNNTSGNLFQKKTKAKCLTDPDYHLAGYSLCDYLINCFWYIHNNPTEAGIVKNLKDWKYSSWPDYYGFRDGKLCNKDLAMKRIGLSTIDLNPVNQMPANEKMIEGIW